MRKCDTQFGKLSGCPDRLCLIIFFGGGGGCAFFSLDLNTSWGRSTTQLRSIHHPPTTTKHQSNSNQFPKSDLDCSRRRSETHTHTCLCSLLPLAIRCNSSMTIHQHSFAQPPPPPTDDTRTASCQSVNWECPNNPLPWYFCKRIVILIGGACHKNVIKRWRIHYFQLLQSTMIWIGDGFNLSEKLNLINGLEDLFMLLSCFPGVVELVWQWTSVQEQESSRKERRAMIILSSGKEHLQTLKRQEQVQACNCMGLDLGARGIMLTRTLMWNAFPPNIPSLSLSLGYQFWIVFSYACSKRNKWMRIFCLQLLEVSCLQWSFLTCNCQC